MDSKNSQEEKEVSTSRRPKFNIKLLLPIVLMLIASVATGYIIQQRPEIIGLTKSQEQSQREIENLVAEVSRLIELPQGTPTVATVTDVSKVNSQTFFRNAQNGDKVLIYPSEKKAILYRPSEKRIVEVGAVNINEQQGVTEDSTAAGEIEPVVSKVVLINGTTVSGLTTRVQSRLDEIEILTAEYLPAQNAQSNEYNDTIVVVLSEPSEANAQVIADELGGTIGDLPEGETQVEGADIIVLIGAENSEI